MLVQWADLRLIKIRCHLWLNQFELWFGLILLPLPYLNFNPYHFPPFHTEQRSHFSLTTSQNRFNKIFHFSSAFVTSSHAAASNMEKYYSGAQRVENFVRKQQEFIATDNVVSFEIHFNKLCIYIFLTDLFDSKCQSDLLKLIPI